MSNAIPKISVVMPVLNRVETIEKALQSIIKQNYPHTEIIVMDGGSTDGTLDIIKRYASQITYWQSERDGNPTNAMNLGIEKASGDLIAILMADDWYQPGLFTVVAKHYQAYPNADMYSFGGRIVSYNDKTMRYDTKLEYSTKSKLDLTISNLCFTDFAAICCRFIKKSFYARIGQYIPFDKNGEYMFSNDKEFLLRASLHNAVNQYIPYLGHNYLAHKDSSTFGENRANTIRMCREHMMLAEKFLASSNLTKQQRYQLIYWYNDQASRLLAYNALEGNGKQFWLVLQETIKKHPLLLPFSFIVTSLRIARKKMAW